MGYLGALSLMVVGLGACVTLGFYIAYKLRHWNDDKSKKASAS